MNNNNSEYTEGMATLQRLIFEDIPSTPGFNHTFRVKMQAQKNGVHAYDFMIGWEDALEVSETILPGFGLMPENYADLDLNICGDAISASAETECNTAHDLGTGTGPGYTATLEISGEENLVLPGDLPGRTTQAVIALFESKYSGREIQIWGNAEFTGGDSANKVEFVKYEAGYIFYDISWQSEATSVVIEFAAHIAAGNSPSDPPSDDGILGYGPGRGASFINGGPYHVITDQFQNNGETPVEGEIGSLDNQLMAGAVLLKPRCSIDGPDSFCIGDEGNLVYTATPVNIQDPTYKWTIDKGTTNASLVGSDETPTLTLNPGTQEGTIKVTFTVTNNGTLSSSCEYETIIENPPYAGEDGTLRFCEGDPTQSSVN
ncbi:hypothetical protein, partial [Christiangramia crocea]